MTTPIITAVKNTALTTPHTRQYRVSHAGGFQGTWWEAGTVVTLDQNLRRGGIVLLVPRHRGSPRFGTIVGGVIRGSSGEPCSSGRWRIVGQVVNQRTATPQLSLFA